MNLHVPDYLILPFGRAVKSHLLRAVIAALPFEKPSSALLQSATVTILPIALWLLWPQVGKSSTVAQCRLSSRRRLSKRRLNYRITRNHSRTTPSIGSEDFSFTA